MAQDPACLSLPRGIAQLLGLRVWHWPPQRNMSANGHFLHSTLQRRTIVHGHDEAGAFPSTQFWYHGQSGTLWWDLDLLYQTLRQQCDRKQKKNEWLLSFNKEAAADAASFQRSQSPSLVTSDRLNHNIATSSAVYTYVAMRITHAKDTKESEFFFKALSKLATAVCSHIGECQSRMTLGNDTCNLTVDKLGQVAGLQQLLDRFHTQTRKRLVTYWDTQYKNGVMVGPLVRDTHNLSDILQLFFGYPRHQKCFRRKIECDYWATVHKSLAAWLANLVDKFVLHNFLNDAASMDRPPPSVIFRGVKRSYSVLTPEAKWLVLSKSRLANTSPSSVVTIMNDPAQTAFTQIGCHPKTADSWKEKEQTMYWENTNFLTTGRGAPHILLNLHIGTRC